jgi:hypothetical protein
LVVVASEDRVRVLDGNDVVADHLRRWGKGEQVEDPAHLQPLIDAKREARQGRGMDRLHHAAPRTRDFLVAMAERGANLGATTNGLLKLLDAYGADELDLAIGEVLERDALHLAAIRQVLDQRRHHRHLPPPVPVHLPDDPRVRDIVVKPHALSSYDNLDDIGADDE